MLLTEKFAPKKLADCIGNKDAIARLKKWFLGFMVSKKQKPLLIYGPVGCGKSAAIKALVQEFQADLIYISPPSSGDELKKWCLRLEELSLGVSLSSNNVLVVFENVDSWGLEKTKVGLNALSNFLKTCSIPIILTTNEFYDQSLSSIKSFCEPLQFKAINTSDLFVLLVEISQKAKYLFPNDELKKIAQNSNGDIRAALNDLQARNSSTFREQQKNQFELLRSIFRLKNYESAKNLSFLIGSTSIKDTLKLFISENIPIEFKSRSEIASSYDVLSKSDVYDGRITRSQYWGYLRYSNMLMLWGIASKRESPISYFVPYKFPTFLQKMSISKQKRQLKKEVLLKIAKRLHCTTKKAFTYLTLLSNQLNLNQNIEQIQSFYGFEEEEILFLKNFKY